MANDEHDSGTTDSDVANALVVSADIGGAPHDLMIDAADRIRRLSAGKRESDRQCLREQAERSRVEDELKEVEADRDTYKHLLAEATKASTESMAIELNERAHERNFEAAFAMMLAGSNSATATPQSRALALAWYNIGRVAVEGGVGATSMSIPKVGE